MFCHKRVTKRKTIKQDYTIHNHILDVVEESKYLGIKSHLPFAFPLLAEECKFLGRSFM
jgi:hypothetical protein